MADKVHIRPKMNKYSVSLSREENELIFELIGDQCQTLCTAFLSITITIELVGVKVHTGYLCLVNSNADEDNRYFLRLYSLEHKRLVWQMEVLGHMKFSKTSATLISYNSRLERTLWEFNFSSKSDTQEFYESVNTVLAILQIEVQKSRRTLRRSGSIRLLFQNVLGIRRASDSHTKSTAQSPLPTTMEQTKTNCIRDIGQPFNFKHIVHGKDAVILHNESTPKTDDERSRPASLNKHHSNMSLSTPDLVARNCTNFEFQL